MDIISLPFNKLIGLQISDSPEYSLMLKDDFAYTNHTGTVHAAALFALAEAGASQFLQTRFPDIGTHIIPLVRKSDMVYKKPAIGSLYARAEFKDTDIEKVLTQLNEKGRSQFEVQVHLFNAENTLVVTGVFHWFAGEIKLTH